MEDVIYNIENFDNQRFFTIEQSPAIIDEQLMKEFTEKCYGVVDVELKDTETFFCELLPAGRINYGPVELDPESILNKISEIYAE